MEKTNVAKLGQVFGKAVTSLALAVTTANVNSACVYMAHQPKLPETAKSLRKF